MTVFLLVSATAEDTARLVENGPRRDFLELADVTDAEVIYRDGASPRGGIRGKLFGPHVRQAWTAARRASDEDVIFADGEHIGLPLALVLAFRRRKPPVVMLGHYVSKPWKARLMRLASLLNRRVTVAVHSVVQQRAAERATGGRWSVPLLPYQVDTEFWRRSLATPAAAGDRPRLLAVGSEHRDYPTLIAAVRDLPVDLTIAAGSHWARETAAAGELPANVELFTEPLTFAELRDRYAAATAVVMPLEDVPNQSGITAMLEAMAMGTPLIVTASRGQRECVSGPLVLGSGMDAKPMAKRGPQIFEEADPPSPNGLYVPPGDTGALRTAIQLVCNDARLRETLAENGRETVELTFPIEALTRNLALTLAFARAR